MLTDFCRFPPEFAARYRQRGHWIGQSLTRALNQASATHPDAIARIDGGRQFTYAEITHGAANLTSHLCKHGLGHGDRAVVQLPNCAEFVIVFHALLRAGIMPFNAIFSHRTLEMTSYVEQLRPALLIGQHHHELIATDTFLTGLEARRLRPGCVIVNAPPGELSDWLKNGTALPANPTPAGEVAFFQLSGGSTGTPKLIPRTHEDYDYSIRASAEICGLNRDTRFLCALPEAHDSTLSSPAILEVIHSGGYVVMAPSPDPAACFDLIASHGVTMAALVPPAVQLWLRHAETHGTPAPLRHLLVGGASFAPDLARRAPAALNCDLQQVFGMAEGLVNYTRIGDDPQIIATTQDRPISPDGEIRVLAPKAGATVPDGQPGALAVRGPFTFRSYYNAPKQNARAFDRDGIHHSGDLVTRDARGNIRSVGRIKDQINRSVAFVVAESPTKPAALRRHPSDLGVTAYKLLNHLRSIDALPLTPIGKIDKSHLREMLLQQGEHA